MDQLLPTVCAFLAASLVAIAVIGFIMAGSPDGFARVSARRSRVDVLVRRRR